MDRNSWHDKTREEVPRTAGLLLFLCWFYLDYVRAHEKWLHCEALGDSEVAERCVVLVLWCTTGFEESNPESQTWKLGSQIRIPALSGVCAY